VIGDELLSEEIHAALAASFAYVRMRRQTLPFKFACPSGVLCSGSGNWGATEIASPSPAAAARVRSASTGRAAADSPTP
jgi:hypothetical protein